MNQIPWGGTEAAIEACVGDIHLKRLRRRVDKSLLPTVLLANVQSPENKLDERCLRLSYQAFLNNCNILCYIGKYKSSWFLFVNNNWWVISNIKEVSRFCLPELVWSTVYHELFYLPRVFIFFVAVSLPPQTTAGSIQGSVNRSQNRMQRSTWLRKEETTNLLVTASAHTLERQLTSYSGTSPEW